MRPCSVPDRTRAPLWALAALAALNLASCGGGPAPRPGFSGEPVFPLTGWYDELARPERAFALAAEGHELVIPYVGSGDPERVRVYLDGAFEAGIGVALQVPQKLVDSDDAVGITEWAGEWIDHPALRWWYLSDEPEIRGVDPAALSNAASALRSLRVSKPILVVFFFARQGARRYAGSFDLLGLDYYPAFRWAPEFVGVWLANFRGTVLGAGRVADKAGVPFVMVLQGYGRADDGSDQFGRRQPTPAETRYMLWTSLLARPKALLWWTRYRASEAWVSGTLGPVLEEWRRLAGDRMVILPAIDQVRGPADALRFIGTDGVERLALVSRSPFRSMVRMEARSLGAWTIEAPDPRGSEVEADGTNLRVSLPPYGIAVFRSARATGNAEALPAGRP